jgi:nucleolar protein 9
MLLPVVPTLLERQWTSLTRTLIERCTVREIDTQAIAVTIDQTYQGPQGFDVKKLLHLDNKAETKGEAVRPVTGEDAFLSRPGGPNKVHFNILAQAMLIVPGSLSALILDSVISLETATLINMAQDHVVSRTLQQACTSKNASMIQRRKLVQRFYGNFGDMSLDKSASRVVDCIWEGTHGLAFIRERIAEELFENEAALRDSPSGRAVWKNWKMDLYKRKRGEWVTQSRNKAGNDGFQSFSELDQVSGKNAPVGSKTPLQMARERHAANKAKKAKDESARGRTMARSNDTNATGSNRTIATVATAAKG